MCRTTSRRSPGCLATAGPRSSASPFKTVPHSNLEASRSPAMFHFRCVALCFVRCCQVLSRHTHFRLRDEVWALLLLGSRRAPYLHTNARSIKTHTHGPELEHLLLSALSHSFQSVATKPQARGTVKGRCFPATQRLRRCFPKRCLGRCFPRTHHREWPKDDASLRPGVWEGSPGTG